MNREEVLCVIADLEREKNDLIVELSTKKTLREKMELASQIRSANRVIKTLQGEFAPKPGICPFCAMPIDCEDGTPCCRRYLQEENKRRSENVSDSSDTTAGA
ncbi:MAG TPA: hypothetical protein V6C76_11480 [Drouetiella sp.]